MMRFQQLRQPQRLLVQLCSLFVLLIIQQQQVFGQGTGPRIQPYAVVFDFANVATPKNTCATDLSKIFDLLYDTYIEQVVVETWWTNQSIQEIATTGSYSIVRRRLQEYIQETIEQQRGNLRSRYEMEHERVLAAAATSSSSSSTSKAKKTKSKTCTVSVCRDSVYVMMAKGCTEVCGALGYARDRELYHYQGQRFLDSQGSQDPQLDFNASNAEYLTTNSSLDNLNDNTTYWFSNGTMVVGSALDPYVVYVITSTVPIPVPPTNNGNYTSGNISYSGSTNNSGSGSGPGPTNSPDGGYMSWFSSWTNNMTSSWFQSWSWSSTTTPVVDPNNSSNYIYNYTNTSNDNSWYTTQWYNDSATTYYYYNVTGNNWTTTNTTSSITNYTGDSTNAFNSSNLITGTDRDGVQLSNTNYSTSKVDNTSSVVTTLINNRTNSSESTVQSSNTTIVSTVSSTPNATNLVTKTVDCIGKVCTESSVSYKFNASSPWQGWKGNYKPKRADVVAMTFYALVDLYASSPFCKSLLSNMTYILVDYS